VEHEPTLLERELSNVSSLPPHHTFTNIETKQIQVKRVEKRRSYLFHIHVRQIELKLQEENNKKIEKGKARPFEKRRFRKSEDRRRVFVQL
jgi:hypothetical protein